MNAGFMPLHIFRCEEEAVAESFQDELACEITVIDGETMWRFGMVMLIPPGLDQNIGIGVLFISDIRIILEMIEIQRKRAGDIALLFFVEHFFALKRKITIDECEIERTVTDEIRKNAAVFYREIHAVTGIALTEAAKEFW